MKRLGAFYEQLGQSHVAAAFCLPNDALDTFFQALK